MAYIFYSISHQNYLKMSQLGVLVYCHEHAADENKLKKTQQILRDYPPTNILFDSGNGGLAQTGDGEKRLLSDHPVISDIAERTNFTPEQTLKIAEALKANMLIPLSHQIDEKATKEEREIEFNNKLRLNVDFASQTSQLLDQKSSGMVLLVPIHARTVDEFETYIEAIRVVQLSGFSLSFEGLPNNLLAYFCDRLSNMGMKWVHIRGVSTVDHMLMAEQLLVKESIKNVFIDTSSWFRPNLETLYLDPITIRPEKLTEEDLKNALINCECGFCRHHFSYNKWSNSKRDEILHMHNLWVFARAKYAIENSTEIFNSQYKWILPYFRDFYQKNSETLIKTAELFNNPT